MGKKKDALAAETLRAAKTKVMVFRPCSCKHDYQDKKYGLYMRAHIVSRKGDVCTVCEKLK